MESTSSHNPNHHGKITPFELATLAIKMWESCNRKGDPDYYFLEAITLWKAAQDYVKSRNLG